MGLFKAIGRTFIFTVHPFRWYKLPFLLLLLYLLATPVIMFLNYHFPAFFTVVDTGTKSGVLFTSTLIQMGDAMLQPWLPNDVVYPTIFLDNPQNFQLGELELLRYSVRILRDKLSRMRTTDMIDPNCDQAFLYISNDPKRWILPSAENRFQAAFDELKTYRTNLEKGSASFYARADNLIELLDQYNSLLGGANTRLSLAPPDEVVTTSVETAGDQYLEGEKKTYTRTPWSKVDDNFYYVRGVAYGLRHCMYAIKYEFREVLEAKKSMELVDRILELLDVCQFEPIYIANGKRNSFWPNHSLSLLATTEDVRQKIRSLQGMLQD
ncbi:DUF2333 family protein [candidate division KSB1 bacterium]|nr:DUF2333 family protein [candidate division KSB1 bacterium]